MEMLPRVFTNRYTDTNWESSQLARRIDFKCVNIISVIVRVVVVHIRESDLRDDETQELCWHGGTF